MTRTIASILALCIIVMAVPSGASAADINDIINEANDQVWTITPVKELSKEKRDSLPLDQFYEQLSIVQEIVAYDDNGDLEILWRREDESSEGEITPFGVGSNMPWISGITDNLMWAETDSTYTFSNLGRINGAPVPGIYSKAVRTRDGLFLFELNGIYCSWVGNPVLFWTENEHNPVLQTNDLDAWSYTIDGGSSSQTVTRGSMYQSRAEWILPTGSGYFDLYADLFEIRYGPDPAQLIVHRLDSPTIYEASYINYWGGVEMIWDYPQQIWNHRVGIQF